jgi:hypothetical protein
VKKFYGASICELREMASPPRASRLRMDEVWSSWMESILFVARCGFRLFEFRHLGRFLCAKWWEVWFVVKEGSLFRTQSRGHNCFFY